MNSLRVGPYLTFEGNCREAMTFYHSCLGGKLDIMPFEGAPMELPPGSEKLVMHANIMEGDFVLMASDTMPGQPVVKGNNVSLSLNCTSKEQMDKLFKSLSAGGQVTMPCEDTFWGAYFGMFTDKFGMHWMLNYDTPKA